MTDFFGRLGVQKDIGELAYSLGRQTVPLLCFSSFIFIFPLYWAGRYGTGYKTLGHSGGLLLAYGALERKKYCGI